MLGLRVSELVMILILLVPLVWALTDALGTPADVWADANQSQGLWVVVMLLLPLAGPVLYFFVARPRLHRQR